MKNYQLLSQSELDTLYTQTKKEYHKYKEKNLQLNMSRGKPSAEQLELSVGMLDCLTSQDILKDASSNDLRNYGILDGIKEIKEIFADILEVPKDNVIVGGNSSLNMMYDTIARAYTHGVYGGDKPWSKCKKVKFLCPSPGYDRHFKIVEFFGFEMIIIPMHADGPDMDMVERYVNNDETVKGIWCVPKYSNPDGITYSDEVVTRFAKLRPAAKDFRIFWDNAYAVHHLDFEDCDTLLNIYEECLKYHSEDMLFMYTSTSKISFPGGGVAALGASKNNISFIKKQISVQTIGPDKLNQMRHVKFFGNVDGILKHMEKHAEKVRPKFQLVNSILEREIKPLGVGSWNMPKGGYFISFNSVPGCAKRIVELCKECGVTLTPAGATFPKGIDPKDRNIRIAPTYPSLKELETAMEIFCLCVKYAYLEKLNNAVEKNTVYGKAI